MPVAIQNAAAREGALWGDIWRRAIFEPFYGIIIKQLHSCSTQASQPASDSFFQRFRRAVFEKRIPTVRPCFWGRTDQCQSEKSLRFRAGRTFPSCRLFGTKDNNKSGQKLPRFGARGVGFVSSEARSNWPPPKSHRDPFSSTSSRTIRSYAQLQQIRCVMQQSEHQKWRWKNKRQNGKNAYSETTKSLPNRWANQYSLSVKRREKNGYTLVCKEPGGGQPGGRLGRDVDGA